MPLTSGLAFLDLSALLTSSDLSISPNSSTNLIPDLAKYLDPALLAIIVVTLPTPRPK